MSRTLLSLVATMSPLCIVLAFFALPLQSAVAQTPSVSATISGYTATGQGATIPEAQWVPISVTRNDGLLHAEVSGDGGSFFTECTIPCPYAPAFTSTSAAGFASAEPGVLRVFASDLVIALPELNAPNVPVTPNTNTVYANIGAGAVFTDYLTVNFPGQPVGTPVQVPFRYAAEVVSNTILGYPPFSLHPLTVNASFRFTGFGDQNFSTDNQFGFSVTTLPSGNYLHSVRSSEFFVSTHVGDVLTISASMGMSGSPRIVNGNNGNGNGNAIGAWADGRNTAGIWLGNLPSGMVITSASGHDYRIDPTLAVTPVAPAQVTATATPADGRAIVSFNTPIGSGVAAITGYTVTSIPDGKVATGTRSPIVVMGLTNGTVYSFTVTSKNAAGMSTTSTPSNSVTPTALLAVSSPSSPVIGVATAGDAQATVNFSVPNDGGSTITGYTATSFPSGITATGAGSPIVVTGLTNGAAYTFTVTASNAVGTSNPSAASNSATPTLAPTVAAAPAMGLAVAGDTQATVNFMAPANDGGSTVTSYTVTSLPGGITATGAASPIVIAGLTNGTAYTFTVTARNSVGLSSPSSISNAVTPASVIVPTPTPAATPAPAANDGGGSMSILLLLSMAAIFWWRRRLE